MAVITFQGKPLQTSGELPAIGRVAPALTLVNGRLQNVSLATYASNTKILHIVPSLDTPVCAASTRWFNEKYAKLANTVILNISADLPFAQDRFCSNEKLKHIIPLSTFRSSFADHYGVKIIEGTLAGLCARAVIIIDQNNKVTYTQWVKEITEEPDYEDVLANL